MIESLRSTAYEEDGRAALRRAEAEGLLGSVNRLPAAAGEAVDGSQSIKELFHEMFPDGGIFEPGANGGRMLGSFSSTDRRDIMHGVVRYSRNFFQIVRSGKYDVTALLQRNEIAIVFIVDKAVNKKARRIWRGLIGSYNLGLAIDRVPVEGATERNGRRVERMTTIGLALHNVEDNSDRAQLVTQ